MYLSTGIQREWPNQQGAWAQELDLEQKKPVGKHVQLTHGHATTVHHSDSVFSPYVAMYATGCGETSKGKALFDRFDYKAGP